MVMLANTQGIADTHPQTEDGTGPVLTLSGISKSFPGVKALSEVSLELFPGKLPPWWVKTARVNPPS